MNKMTNIHKAKRKSEMIMCDTIEESVEALHLLDTADELKSQTNKP